MSQSKMKEKAKTPLDVGRSISVPNVQDLERILSETELSGEIPERYVRPEVEEDPVIPPAAAHELPVIDISNLLASEELAKLGLACRDWGFFQVINHGIPIEIIENMRNDIMEFFKLPLKEREEIKQVSGNRVEGYGQLFVHSEEQKLDWGDMLVLVTHPYTRRDSRFWPTNPSSFRDTLDKYTSEMRKLTKFLVESMAKDLGITDWEFFGNLISQHLQSVRINYYPRCKVASKVLGLSAHSDSSGVTVLLQVNDVDGLQIKKDGKWCHVKARSGALIVNVGDIIEITSNGKYKSVEHRVVVNTQKERLSIAAFHTPPFETIVRPFPDLIEAEVEHYKAITVEDLMKAYMMNELDGKKQLENLMLKEWLIQ